MTRSRFRYLSVCSGIEAATVAWDPLGWEPAAFAEVDRFPSAVLAHHYPTVPNLGDLTQHETWNLEPIDLLVGGTPCQSFSVAGLRGGMGDKRGQLALEFFRLARRLRPRWIVWENVPGVLSSNRGRDFGSILGALGELGYGYAYRVLDAQFFGVPQRRRRVFVVGCAGGSWQRAAAVLFERESLRGDPAPSSEAREKAARDFGVGVAKCVTTKRRENATDETLVPVAFDLTQATSPTNRSNPQPSDPCHPLVVAGRAPVLAFSNTDGNTALAVQADCAPPISCRNGDPGMVVCATGGVTHALTAEDFDASEDGTGRGAPIVATDIYNGTVTGSVFASLTTAGSGAGQTGPTVMQNRRVRRLMPIECERLQGFPDKYTAINYRGKPASDAARYKALGNSMAVPVMRWIGERIQMVEQIGLEQ